jgi:hypothetical protein
MLQEGLHATDDRMIAQSASDMIGTEPFSQQA